MLERAFTKRFKKELKLMGERGLDLGKLRKVTFQRTGSHSDLF